MKSERRLEQTLSCHCSSTHKREDWTTEYCTWKIAFPTGQKDKRQRSVPSRHTTKHSIQLHRGKQKKRKGLLTIDHSPRRSFVSAVLRTVIRRFPDPVIVDPSSALKSGGRVLYFAAQTSHFQTRAKVTRGGEGKLSTPNRTFLKPHSFFLHLWTKYISFDPPLSKRRQQSRQLPGNRNCFLPVGLAIYTRRGFRIIWGGCLRFVAGFFLDVIPTLAQPHVRIHPRLQNPSLYPMLLIFPPVIIIDCSKVISRHHCKSGASRKRMY